MASLRHEDEYEMFVGGYEEEEDGELCRRCQDWPCRCIADERLDEVEQ